MQEIKRYTKNIWQEIIFHQTQKNVEFKKKILSTYNCGIEEY